MIMDDDNSLVTGSTQQYIMRMSGMAAMTAT